MIRRWLPAAISLAVLVTASVVTLELGDTPTAAPTVDGPVSATPVLSVRRNLEPLRDAAADNTLRTGLDAFVAGQPADTCLQVQIGDLTYEHRVQDPQSPASVQKLLTAVAALSELGPQETYATDVLASTPPAGGVVDGDLWLRGGGDPILSTGAYAARFRNQPQTFSDIARLADAVVAAGVTSVTGAVVGDESRYDTVRYNPAWPPRFITQDQIGPLSALSVNDGFEDFPASGRASLDPAQDPAAQAATVFADLLRERGVTIGAPARSGVTPPEATPVATHRSPPLTEIVAEMLGESDNNTAELLLKELGLRRAGEGSFPAGQAAVTAILGELGLVDEVVRVVDGSGLATEDVVTCRIVSALLDHDPTEDTVVSALAVAGRSGTLAGRWLDTDLVGRVRAKTGTLNQVTALAGVAETTGAGTARFALVVNVAEPDRIQIQTIADQQRLAELLVAYPDRPDVERFVPEPPS